MHTHPVFGSTFCLLDDDFGIKYTNRRDANHLLAALEELYVVTIEWNRSIYLTMHMAWDYSRHTMDISMSGYVAKFLNHFQHRALGRPQHSPRE
jgi:hypothetical protein